MANITILTQSRQNYAQWSTLLKAHNTEHLNSTAHPSLLTDRAAMPLIIVDDELITTTNVLPALKNSGAKILLIGNDWSDDRQIDILVFGIAGYCDKTIAEKSLVNAVNSILAGDVWVQRRLVSRIIDRLILHSERKAPEIQGQPPEHALSTLTHREREVAQMLQNGASNKTIATTLSISERTVKAHLTSVFQKFNVQNRVNLILLLTKNRAINL